MNNLLNKLLNQAIVFFKEEGAPFKMTPSGIEEPIWVIPKEKYREIVQTEKLQDGEVIYSVDEILFLAKLQDEQVKQIHLVKKKFNGIIVETEKGPKVRKETK